MLTKQTKNNKIDNNMKFDTSMFEKIKDKLNSNPSGGQYDHILKFPAGHTFTLRFLPILEEGKDPLKHYKVHQWTSPVTGKFTSTLSLQSFGERDPIAEYRYKQWKAWKDANPTLENKEYNGDIDQKEQWAINVEVVDYPSNDALNGTVKVHRFGPQIKEIIDIATEGARADEIGWDIFNPTSSWVLKIVAEKQGEYTTYKNSYFTDKKTVKLKEAGLDALYENLHDLDTIEAVKTYDELKTILDDDFGVKDSAPEERKPLAKSKPTVEEPEDEIPMDFSKDESGMSDEELDALLADV